MKNTAMMELLKAAEKLYEYRNIILTRAGVAGCRETSNGEWVRDPASQSFMDLGVAIANAKAKP